MIRPRNTDTQSPESSISRVRGREMSMERLKQLPPVGDAFFQGLLAECEQYGSEIETVALELKGSEVLSGGKAGFAKIAKFIIGASNRDPELARTEFQGYAIMVIGVESDGELSQVSRCEDQEINSQIEGYLGGEAIQWVTHWIHPDGDQKRGVLFLLVPPPQNGDQIRWCRKDGVELTDGAIYVRSRGETRIAKGIDLEMLTRRAGASPSQTWGLAVDMHGTLVSDASRYSDTVRSIVIQRADEMRKLVSGSGAVGIMLGSAYNERRSKKEYLKEIDDWQKQLEDLASGLSKTLMFETLPSLSVTVINEVESFVEDLLLEFTLPKDFFLVDRKGLSEKLDKTLKSPIPWGKDHQLTRLLDASFPRPFPNSHHSVASDFESVWLEDIDRETGRVSLRIPELRPRESVKLSSSRYVLLVTGLEKTLVDMTWEATAKGRDRRYEVPASIHLKAVEVNERISEALRRRIYQ